MQANGRLPEAEEGEVFGKGRTDAEKGPKQEQSFVGKDFSQHLLRYDGIAKINDIHIFYIAVIKGIIMFI